MYKLLILLCSLTLLTSCQEDKKEIEFKKIVNLNLGNLSKENAKLNATVVFMNLTEQEFDMQDLVLDLSVDGKDIGTIVSKITKKIQPNSEFSIPVHYTYETKEIVQEGHDPSSTYAVQLLGDLTLLNAKGEEITCKVKFADTYEFLTKKEERIEKREERKKRREERKEEKQ